MTTIFDPASPRPLVPLRTGSDRALVTAHAVVAMAGASVSLVAQQNFGSADAPPVVTLWIVIAGGTGASVGLAVARRYFGHRGAAGALRAALGAAVAMLTGALIAGLLAMPFWGVTFGPLQVLSILAAHPLICLGWVVALEVAQLWLILWRDWRGPRSEDPTLR